MIFIPMGDDDSSDTMFLVFEIVFKIGDDKVDPEHVVFREHDARIHNQNILTIFINGHVFPTSEAPERDNS